MKTLQKSKTLIACSIVAALSACDSESYTPEEKANEFAPEHGGNIVRTFHEKDAYEALYAFGGVDGTIGGEGKAIDRDGDILLLRNGTVSPADAPGIELSGPRIGVFPSAIAPLIDTGETYTIVLSYDISDGVNAIPRTMTINIEGEDSAPVATGDLIGNFTKDAGVGVLDLLTNVADEDGEPLTVEAASVVADSANPFTIDFTVEDNMLNLDIASIAEKIPDGSKVSFNYTYVIKDHNHEISRNMTINILGVKDVAGAPLIPDYFLTSELNETDTVQVYDLVEGVVDREDDAIVMHDLTLNGDTQLPYGVELEGNSMSFDPHAYFNQVANGEFKELVFSYKVSDDQGNTSDGERTLTIKLNGEQTNLLATAFPNFDFEDASQVGPLDQATNPGGFVWDWAGWACPEKAFRAESARTGNYGMRMGGSFCHFEIRDIILEIENDQKYAMSYWLRNETSNGANGNPYVPLYASGELGSLDNKFWSGSRYFNQGLNTWFEHVQLMNTNDAGNWDGYEKLTVNFGLLKYDDTYAGGTHDIDDLSMVKFGHFDTAAHDMLVDDAGLFENDEAVVASGGVVEIRDDAGDSKLYVDTSGEASGVTVSIPVKSGAIRIGERFAVSLNAQLINHDALYAENAGTQVKYSVSLSNGTELIQGNGDGSTWGPNDSAADIIITEEHGRSADIDWSGEMMTLNITLPEANAQYYINNVRLIAIP